MLFYRNLYDKDNGFLLLNYFAICKINFITKTKKTKFK